MLGFFARLLGYIHFSVYQTWCHFKFVSILLLLRPAILIWMWKLNIWKFKNLSMFIWKIVHWLCTNPSADRASIYTCRSNLWFVDFGDFCDLTLHWKISVLACVGTRGLICFAIGAGMLWLQFIIYIYIILLLTFFSVQDQNEDRFQICILSLIFLHFIFCSKISNIQ